MVESVNKRQRQHTTFMVPFGTCTTLVHVIFPNDPDPPAQTVDVLLELQLFRCGKEIQPLSLQAESQVFPRCFLVKCQTCRVLTMDHQSAAVRTLWSSSSLATGCVAWSQAASVLLWMLPFALYCQRFPLLHFGTIRCADQVATVMNNLYEGLQCWLPLLPLLQCISGINVNEPVLLHLCTSLSNRTSLWLGWRSSSLQSALMLDRNGTSPRFASALLCFVLS